MNISSSTLVGGIIGGILATTIGVTAGFLLDDGSIGISNTQHTLEVNEAYAEGVNDAPWIARCDEQTQESDALLNYEDGYLAGLKRGRTMNMTKQDVLNWIKEH